MIVRSIDIENDWNFGKGKSDYRKDNDAVAQSVKTRLQSFLGDCFFNIGAGIDWFNLLGSKNLTGLVLSIKTTILNTRSVKSLVDLGVELDENRKQTLTYSVETVFSTEEPLTGTAEIF